ncbi:PD-(D/E)XK nuclease family protein [Streptomyces sp. NPDC050161]|uniref:PD-(D/E)XK nuclease family protein n=1 Tax=Streptomyces sp. NPDC050161 TaxID=3365604 RepID=UPI003791D05D
MTECWSPPDGVYRKTDVVTLSLGMLKGGAYRCPAADALKARGYAPQQPVSRNREDLEHFALGPFMTALDGAGRRSAPVHDGLRQWTAHAVRRYRQAFGPEAEEQLAEIRTPWVYRHRLPEPDMRGAREYRITAWGRCLHSADGRLRELRLPVHRLSGAEPSRGRTAAAALVLAEAAPGPPPERVRVVEFALFDGRVRILFDGTRAQAIARYRDEGAEAVTALLDSRDYRPGTACADCAFVGVCPALRREPGLLGVSAPGRPRRTWSVTNGRSYAPARGGCPARDHMRRLGLPPEDAVERSAAAERGRAVHAYLAQRHSHGPLRPCAIGVPDQWVPDGFVLPDEERRLGAVLLRRHAAVCPVSRVRDRSDVWAEPRVVRHDTTADVMVIAAPDLLYRDGGSWVWRETKTSMSDQRRPGALLEAYPQLALGVLLLARGSLGGSPVRARVELEVLRPSGADLEILDPFTPVVRSAADEVTHALAADWYTDDRYAAAPGAACARCEMARWCSQGVTGEATA